MESLPAYQASVQLNRVFLPVVIAAGTFGNVAVVVIHCRLPPSQRSGLSVYFTALAVSDTATLWTGWYETLATFGVTLSAEYHVHRDYSDVIVDAGDVSDQGLDLLRLQSSFSLDSGFHDDPPRLGDSLAAQNEDVFNQTPGEERGGFRRVRWHAVQCAHLVRSPVGSSGPRRTESGVLLQLRQ